MKYIQPDFYARFHCIADKCRHSCCKGWEIDIDSDTAKLYSQISGKLGEDLKRNISYKDNTHFILTEGENCPFLRGDGLCRIIIELGESALCDICTEHPRFYNYVSDREEVGLGLCCEEAVRLLLDGDKPIEFFVSEDEEEINTDDTLIFLRDRIFDILSDGSVSLYHRMEKCAELLGFELPEFDPKDLAETMEGLEILGPNWKTYLFALKTADIDVKSSLQGIKYQRLAQYFVYRHFTCEDTALYSNLYFALVSTEIICALASLGFELNEVIRMYSSEIEYEEENTLKIKEKCGVSPK